MLDSTKLLFDLQQVNAIAQEISGCLDPEAIARQVTEALVSRFPCAFTRIWLVEPDQSSLRLVASSGLYTHINGFFSRVPMGAYKVGKIAQNRMPFLSNHLADESWVKDREWAIQNKIQGFAGYPIVAGDRVLGVLVTFSHAAMAPEFLEVLQVLGMTVGVALDAAIQVQQTQPAKPDIPSSITLSDQLSLVLKSTRLMLVGTERSLTPSMAYGVLRSAELLNQLNCHYCRLTYGTDHLSLEVIVAGLATSHEDQQRWRRSQLDEIKSLAIWLGGTFTIQPGQQNQLMQCLLTIPCPSCQLGPYVLVQSRLPIVQVALSQLCRNAGLYSGDINGQFLNHHHHNDAVLLTDQIDAVTTRQPVIWICHSHSLPIPAHVSATIDLSANADQLKSLVTRVHAGERIDPVVDDSPQRLSDREQEIMSMLAQGLRDREIAKQLYISESTVKFHIKNSLTKLNGKNRYQAVYEAAQRRWI
ncbi:MAG: LuxR C-terminal-related transcriptional regulator [Cyanobacteria bacterium P01_E01_bin.6]